MGILANHVPTIEQLKPGLVEIIEESSGNSKQYFRALHVFSMRSRPLLTLGSLVSGGFAVVQPDSQLSINAVEGYALEDFSADSVRSQLAEAQKIASGNGSAQDIAEANVEIEVGAPPTIFSKLSTNYYSSGPGELAGSHEIS